jgi:glucose uptake protein GlcU
MTAVAACASITVAYLMLQSFPGPLYVLSNTSEAAFSLIPVLLSFYALKTKTPFIKSTRWLALGFLLWFLGEVTYSIYALFLGDAIPYPSIADFFWLLGYPFILVGIVVFIWQFRYAIKRRSLEIAIGLAVMASVLVAVFLVIPVMSISSDLTTNLVGFAYPISDIALLIASILGFLLFRGGKVSRGWYLMASGVLIFSIADILFSYATARGAYFDGDPLELLYDYGYVFFGLSIYIQLKGLWE